MIRVLLLSLLFLVSNRGFSQTTSVKFDFDKKTGVVTIGNEPRFRVEKETKPGYSIPNAVNVYNQQDSLLIVFALRMFESPAKGHVNYYEVVFVGQETFKADLQANNMNDIIRVVCDNKLVLNGSLDLAAVKLFCTKTGTQFTDARLKGY